ncbi:RNA polymerase sigma factor [Cupriavidus sp. DB3]|uniref:RNA polymerase sigma factor n=1 Tax=Cupriavidus sp. DB3 TaxID=2873259 RepID=UPI001CF251F8|nr:RNA polymerase sigma factor [Cupriavidus sp. DB3]MCA7085664.1 RNA polymerase sigma factor [Cupriavidus sp. DB3]
MGVREELIDHVPRLRRYARALVHNRELADDLVQDTLERALRHARQYHDGTDLRAWLFTIMHNAFVNQMRGAGMRATHVPMDDDTLSDGLSGADWHSTAANPAGSLEVRDLDYALQRLPAEQREVVLLIGLESMSYAEVALALGIPVGTVMSRLSRGRERLRSLMAGVKPEARLRVVR